MKREHKEIQIVIKSLLLYLTLDFSDVKHLFNIIHDSRVFATKSDAEIDIFLLSLGKSVRCEEQMKSLVA